MSKLIGGNNINSNPFSIYVYLYSKYDYLEKRFEKFFNKKLVKLNYKLILK